MNRNEYFMVGGIVIGAILWGSLTTLIENGSTKIAVLGLVFACLCFGMAMGFSLCNQIKELNK